MKKHINLIAYDNYETIDSKEAIEKYRKEKINGVKGSIEFIQNIFLKKQIDKLNVLEIGSGNSKVLYALEEHAILNSGIGIEVSKSRFEFAEKWKRDMNFNKTTNINKNIFDINFEKIKNIDLCIGFDLVFQFFLPMGENFDYNILKKIYNSLKTDGVLILELSNLTQMKNKKTWDEFYEPDPWRFSLWNCQYDEEKEFLQWDKYFIHRTEAKIDKTSIVLKQYSKKQIETLLKSVGFKNISFCGNLNDDKYVGKEFEFVVMGEK